MNNWKIQNVRMMWHGFSMKLGESKGLFGLEEPHTHRRLRAGAVRKGTKGEEKMNIISQSSM